MMYSLSKPIRQLLAVTLLVVALGALAMFTVMPVVARVTELQDRIELERQVLGRLAVAAVDDGGAAEARQRIVAGRLSGLFLPGESESIRVSYVQSQLIDILTAQRLKPRSTRNLPARERTGLRLVGVQMQVTVPVEELQVLLRDIEAHKPPLLIEALHITPVTNLGGNADDTRGMLDARIDVFGIEPQKKGP